MKSKMNVVILAAVLVIAGAAAAVFVFSDDTENREYDLRDELGRGVDIPEEVESIICMGPGSLRLVSYLSSVDKVIGIEAQGKFYNDTDQTFYAVHEEFLSGLPEVSTSAEGLIHCNPDVIITSSIDRSAVDLLEKQTGITIFAINNAYEINENYYRQMLNLGKFLGKEDRAQYLIDGTKSLIDEITSEITESHDEKAYAGGMYFQGNPGFLKGTGNFQPFDLSQVKNAIPEAKNKEPYTILGETLRDYNPDVIFLDAVQLDFVVADLISGYDLFKEINAVKNGKIYSNMVTKCYMNNWENQLVNAFYVASVMHGDNKAENPESLFEWDFETKADEVMELYFENMGVTYNQIKTIQGGCGPVTL